MPFGLIVVLQVLLAIHAARTGRIMPSWSWDLN